MTFDHSSPATKGVGASERAPPLSFDQISPPQSYRDGFSIQSARLENHSLWSRQPSEQLFGAALDGSSGSVRGSNSQASSQNGINNRFTTAVRPEGSITQNNNTAMGSANRVDSELEVIESLHLCLSKLLQLEGSEWLFRMDNGSDEDLVAAVATAEKSKLTAAETHDQYSSPDQWQAHSRPMTSLFNSNKLARTLHSCGDSCVWGKKGLLISFGVWSVHRLLELSLMESRPELWGKYTYVLNRLQVFHYLNPKPTLFCFTFWIFHVVDTSLNMMQLEPQHIGIIRQQFPRIGLKTSCFQPLPRTGCYRLAHM
jgi:ethylene-insensitive protein 2